MSTTYRTVETSRGPGRLAVDRARQPVATLLLGHGAGNGIDTPDLTALAAELPRNGITVIRFEQPWKVAGKRVASAPATLDAALIEAAGTLRSSAPLVVGGRSAGARSAARTAKELGAAGCLALAFPLHPPGKPEKTRLTELEDTGMTTLVVQGERDAFGKPDEFPDDVDLAVVPGADHSFKVSARAGVTQEEALEVIVESVLEWMVREIAGS